LDTVTEGVGSVAVGAVAECVERGLALDGDAAGAAATAGLWLIAALPEALARAKPFA